MSNRHSGKPMWLVRSGSGSVTIFVGTLQEVVAHMNALHLSTGFQHSATEVK